MGGRAASSCSRAYVEAKQKQNVLDYDDLLLYWAQMMAEPALADDLGARFDHVLVDEYQDTNRLQASILLRSQADRARPDGRRRRRAVDLLVSRRDGAQHSRLSRPLHAQGRAHHAGAQLPLDAADPRRRQRRDRSRRRALHQEPLVGPRVGRAARARQRRRRHRAGAATSSSTILANREAGIALEIAGGAVSHLAPQRHARSRADPAQHPVRQIRRAQIPRGRARQGRAGGAALGGESARPRRRISRRAACCPGIGPAIAARVLDAMAASADPAAMLATVRRRAPAPSWRRLRRP